MAKDRPSRTPGEFLFAPLELLGTSFIYIKKNFKLSLTSSFSRPSLPFLAPAPSSPSPSSAPSPIPPPTPSSPFSDTPPLLPLPCGSDLFSFLFFDNLPLLSSFWLRSPLHSPTSAQKIEKWRVRRKLGPKRREERRAPGRGEERRLGLWEGGGEGGVDAGERRKEERGGIGKEEGEEIGATERGTPMLKKKEKGTESGVRDDAEKKKEEKDAGTREGREGRGRGRGEEEEGDAKA